MRRILGARPREHTPFTAKPTLVGKRVGTQWGVAMLHGGQEVHWFPVEEARRMGANLIALANVCARPGELPQEDLG